MKGKEWHPARDSLGKVWCRKKQQLSPSGTGQLRLSGYHIGVSVKDARVEIDAWRQFCRAALCERRLAFDARLLPSVEINARATDARIEHALFLTLDARR